jgi:hypothetical protein
MAQCTTCISGLGIITIIVDGVVEVIECPECDGVGGTCSFCGMPVCDCYKPKEKYNDNQ